MIIKVISALLVSVFAVTVFAADTYTLEADQVTRVDNSTFQASGNVILKVRDIVFNSDNLTYDQANERVTAQGNVTIISPTQEISAEEIDYNIRNETGKAKNIKGFLAPFNYICASSMERTGATTFTVEDARISTCPGGVPDWSVSMYHGKLEVGGYINASHATADILNTPLLYSPKLLYPVSTERQSGFLIPNLGFLSDKGAFLSLKYFIAPDVNYDFTLGLNAFSKSGIQELIEARYAESALNNFYGSFERIDDAVSESDANVRWRAVLKNTYFPINNLELTVNANHVSDYLYMRDYDDFGLSEYNKSNKENMFFEEARVKYYSEYADIAVLYRNDFQFRDSSTGYIQTNVERLPSFSISKVVTEIPYVILDYNASYDRIAYDEYLYNSPTTGYTNKWSYDRLNLDMNVLVPLDFKLFTLTPSLGASYTRWENSSKEMTGESYYNPDIGEVHFINGKSAERFSVSADLSLAFRELYRDFGIFRHSIQNVVKLKYAPKLKQDGLPDFIEGDKINYHGSVSYEMINFLRGKKWDAKLTLSQGYDVLQESPVLPFKAKLLVTALKIVTNTFEMDYKHTGELKENEKRFQYFNNDLRIDISRYMYVTGNYTFDSKISESFNTSARVGAGFKIWRISLEGYNKWQGYNKDLSFKNLVPLEQGASVIYHAECWSLGLEVEASKYNINMKDGQYKRKEQKIYVTFSLKGLGESSIQFMKLKDEELIQ